MGDESAAAVLRGGLSQEHSNSHLQFATQWTAVPLKEISIWQRARGDGDGDGGGSDEVISIEVDLTVLDNQPPLAIRLAWPVSPPFSLM